MTKKKLLLIGLDWIRRAKDPPLSLGQASILANLQAYEVSTQAQTWAVNTPEFNSETVTDYILSQAHPNTDVAFGAYIWNENHLQKILNRLKAERFPGRIILGGPQVSYVKHGLEKYYPQADVFVRGYGEEAITRLMLAPTQRPVIKGVHYANEPDLGLSSQVDLETLPSPFLNGLIPPQNFLRFETKRGCPFQCSFCQHRESHPSNMRQNFAISRIEAEIAWMAENPIIKDLAVLDPTFNAGNYLEVMRHFIEKDYRGRLSLQCRMEMMKPAFFELLSQFNRQGHVVLEFGLQTIHRAEEKFIERGNNLIRVKEVLAEARSRNLEVEISLIFGLPAQTVASFEASINFCKELNIGTILAYPLMLLRGTELYYAKEKLGLVESSDVKVDGINRLMAGIPHVIESPSFSREDWFKMADMAAALDEYNQNKKPKMQDTLKHTFWGDKKGTQAPVSPSQIQCKL
jgi:radical SAM superfamily enzyme YgiQ (UPF0313 family)